MTDSPTRIAIIGAGHVGATFAYALLLSGLAAEIVLIDANRERAEGEAMDLSHTVPFTHPTRIWAGDLADCAGAAVTVITAGAAQRPGETRLDLVKKNAAIFREFVPAAGHHLGFNDIKTIEVRAVLTALAGGPPFKPDFREAWEIQRVVDAIVDSARERKWVDL